jgi:TonB family protein
VNEAVNEVLEQREAMEKGLSASLVLSALAHVLVIVGGLGVSWLLPREPPIRATMGFVVQVPRGGGGAPVADPAPPAPAPVQSAAPEAPAPVAPPKVIKPPKEEPPKRALPPPDPRKSRTRPTPTPPPRTAGRAATPEDRGRTAGGGAPGATGTSSQTPGVGIGPVGPGSPIGTGSDGDWYLAGVQRKIWMVWTRQIKTGFQRDIAVSFTILADGSLEDGSVQIVQSGGAALLDLAAQRAVYSAAPFGPLPRNYGTNRYTVQALFQPTP